MAQVDSRSDLQARVRRLREAARILELEILKLEQELKKTEGRASAVLTEDFFWESVFPRLLANGEMTGAQLRERLRRDGIFVDDRRFRTFLSRARDRGWLALRERSEGHPWWRVADQAVKDAKERMKKGQ